MKRFKFLTSFVLIFLIGFTVKAQDIVPEKLNLPGDNLNLFAVMKLFQDSETLEGFERNLNAEDSKINNLDLNGDDKIDYIKVIDYPDGDDHTIVLQVAVNAKENQDVAVFTVNKDANNNVVVQLIGDESLYGKDYIIEPNYADNGQVAETPNPGYVQGNNVIVKRTTYVSVNTWPLIRFMFMPSYVACHSPWHYGYYPSYWNPWRPYYWDYYYGYHSHWNTYYYGHYRPWHSYRYTHWNDYYYKNHRAYSNTVYQRRESGAYKSTYSRPETRKQGSADYLKRYPADRNRTDNRNNVNRDMKRQDSRQNVKSTTPRQNDSRNVARPANNRSVKSENSRQDVKSTTPRQNNNRNVSRSGNNGTIKSQDVNKPATRNDATRSPRVNTRTERQTKSAPAVRTENKRTSAPRQENTRRSSQSQRSERRAVKSTQKATKTKTERK